MNIEAFTRFITSPTYRNGGIIHAETTLRKKGERIIEHRHFRKFSINEEEHTANIFDFKPPISIDRIRALTTTKPKSEERLPTNPKPTTY